MIVLYFIVGIICAFVCASMAKSKNRESGLWGVLGFFFGIFAVLILALLDRREPGAGMSAGSGQPSYPASAAALPPASTADEIAKWKALLDEGAISEDEFAAKKRELLAR